jgi:hypothetical protein
MGGQLIPALAVFGLTEQLWKVLSSAPERQTTERDLKYDQ